MKKIMTAVLGVMLLGGCKMKEFSSSPFYEGNEVKFTGAVEDRVNLWPLAYYREPVGSLAWPLISWGDDHRALRPFYSQYKQSGSGDYDEFNFFWPISQFDTKHRDYRVFPLFWGKSHSDKPYFCLFPAVWWNREFAGVFPVFWDNEDDGGSGFCVFPMFWSETTPSGSLWHTLWPLYYYGSHPKSDKNIPSDTSEFWALCYLAGFEREQGKFLNHRFLPFYFCEGDDFYSLSYSRYRSGGRVKSRVLCGLAGCDSNADGDYQASWLFPLYCRDESQFNSPVYSYWDDAKKGTRGFFSLPLLSGANWETNSCDKTWFTLAGLVGGSSNASGSHKTNWALPLFLREEGESFYSIPFGWSGGGSAYTNTYFAAGLAGFKSGRKEGGWMFPLFNYKKDADFDEKESWLDEAKLPESVKVWTRIETNKVWNFEKKAHEEVVGPKQHADYVSAYDTKTHLLVFDNDKSVYGCAPYGVTNRYEMTERHKLGNKLVFNHESNRKVCFDTATREKISDSEEGDTSLLLLLYNGEHRADTAKGTSYTSHRVLWKLWDWEEENGDVALDVFPGFTYDSKKNGYSKTSFLWRFFRYENDPEEGKKVDLLFIPVWR